MKEVSSCQEKIDHGSNQRRKKKKKKLNSLLNQTGLFQRKVPSYHENVDLEAIKKHTKLYRIDCLTHRAFCICLIVWMALFDKRSLPWRSVAEASLVNHEHFPGRDVLKSALLNGQTWFARSGTRVAELGSPAGLKKKKKNSCRDWSSELCCSRKKVVEPMGKASLVLDMVDVQEHDSGQRWNKFLFFLFKIYHRVKIVPVFCMCSDRALLRSTQLWQHGSPLLNKKKIFSPR